MLPSWRIGTVFGIAVRIHWTFWFLILYVLYTEEAFGDISKALPMLSLVAAVFGCVFLHELGHALMARQYGIRTRDITLLPIGGLARLESMPRQPIAEFLIAIAGPAVNVVIAAVLFVILLIVGMDETFETGNPMQLPFLAKILLINVGLVVFNIIPAFPMDGGRILRSFLASRQTYLRATENAVRVGRYVSFVMIGLGIFYGAYTIAIIGFLMIFAGFAELVQVRTSAIMEQLARDTWTPEPFGPTQKVDPGTIDALDVRRIDDTNP